MKKIRISHFLILILPVILLSACGKQNPASTSAPSTDPETFQAETPFPTDTQPQEHTIVQTDSQAPPDIRETDYSSYYNGLTGCAVFYSPNTNTIDIYNPELAKERRSPCSTFKIISLLTALENGIITPDDSHRKWSGETFWNSDWNRDMEFQEAFKTSCIWYFRQLIDETQKETMAESLKKLSYGNQDISDWSGSLNANNSNPALTGFWVESSLIISPLEQAETLARIFEPGSLFKKSNIDALSLAMKTDQNRTNHSIYGKTGFGKLKNRVLDAWFVGYFYSDENKENTYFAVYLGETNDASATSAMAKNIAIELIADFY